MSSNSSGPEIVANVARVLVHVIVRINEVEVEGTRVAEVDAIVSLNVVEAEADEVVAAIIVGTGAVVTADVVNVVEVCFFRSSCLM